MPVANTPEAGSAGLDDLLQAQRTAAAQQGIPSAAQRRERLGRAIDMLVSRQQQLCAALSHDFGQRPAQISRFLDILPALHALKLARRRLARWMRPKRSSLGLPMGVFCRGVAIRRRWRERLRCLSWRAWVPALQPCTGGAADAPWDFAGLLGLRPPYSRRLNFWLDLLIRR